MARVSKKSSKPPEFVSTKKMHAKPDWLEIRFNDLIKRIEGKKKISEATGKISVLGLTAAEYESIVDGLKRAGKAGYLKEDIKTLKKDVDRYDEEAITYLETIRRAQKVVPKKGAKVSHYREAVLRLGEIDQDRAHSKKK